MFDPGILIPSVLNGLTTGAVYALIALGLTLIYGVLHIINFAHGACLMLALYAVYFLKERLGIDPYLALPLVVAAMFALGYGLQRVVINRASHGKDENILLATLGIAIVMENLALLFFQSDTRTIDTSYSLSTVAIGPAMIAVPKLVAFGGALVVSALLFLIMGKTDLGRAIRAVAKEKEGAKLMGIDVDHVYAMSFGIGLACLGAAACFLLPAYYVNPQVGSGFVLVRILFGHLPDRIGGLPVAIVSLAVEAFGQALIWQAPSPVAALAGAFLTGLGCSMIFPAMGREVVRLVAPQLRGTALGGFSAFQDLAYGLTGPVAGLLADRAGYGGVFLIGAGAALAGLAIALRLRSVARA
jgi:branched-chain amino acid transport system permease protein